MAQQPAPPLNTAMPHLLPSPTILAFLALATVVTYWVSQSRSRNAYPPGPPAIPIFGNALQMSKSSPWLKFVEWGTIYGDITFARVFSRKLVIINSYELGHKLLEKRLCYANRPRRFMCELSGYNRVMIFKDYGAEVKRGRKLIHNIDLRDYYGGQVKVAHQLAGLLLNDPSNFLEHIRRMMTAGLLEFTYGYAVKGANDVLVGLAEEVMDITGLLVSPNRYLVDMFPFLNSLPEGFPGTGFKRDAREFRNSIDRLMQDTFEDVLKQSKDGSAKSCFTSNHLDGKIDAMSKDDMELLKWAAGMIVTAGTDTNSSILSSFFLAMTLHPEVQTQAQENIDSVLGPNNLPTFADRERLPYIDCIIKELLRWHPPAPLIGRSLATDDVVNGHVIPAGSFVVANIWGFTHDPNHYPEPSKFYPDRFLPNADPHHACPPDPQLYTFGLGRRRCPGSDLAMNTLFIMIATILTLFEITPEVDGDGRPKLPEERFRETLTCHPVPFKCKVTPRSEGVATLVAYANELQ